MVRYDGRFFVSGGLEVDSYVAAAGRLSTLAVPRRVPASYHHGLIRAKENEVRT